MDGKVQANMLAYLLRSEDSKGRKIDRSKGKGAQLFSLFENIDEDVFFDTFNVEGVETIIATIGRHFETYKELPSESVWHEIKKTSSEYQKWFANAPQRNKKKLENFEAEIYAPVKDESFLEHQIISLLCKSHMAQVARDEIELGASLEKTPMEALEWGMQERRKFLTKINGLNKKSEGSLVLDVEHDYTNLADAEAIVTCFKSIRLYKQNLTVLAAPPKSFKTGISQNEAIELMKQGHDVLYIDLENGMKRMMRRFIQSLLGVPKEWVYANSYVEIKEVEKEHGVKHYDRSKAYKLGDQIFKVVPNKEEIDKKKVWTLSIQFFEANTDLPENPEDWDKTRTIEVGEVTIAQKFKEENERIRRSSGGNIRLESMRNAAVEDIKALIEGYETEMTSEANFYSGAREKILILDWGQLVKNKNSKLAFWEKSRDNYSQYREVYESHDLYMLVIEAPTDYLKLSEPDFNPENLLTASNKNIVFDAVSVAVIMATKEEKAKGYRRIAISVDRDSALIWDYVKVDYNCFRAVTVTPDHHREVFPELWAIMEGKAEAPTKPSKSGKQQGESMQDKIQAYQTRGRKKADS